MGQKIIVKIRKFWRKKSASKTMPEQEKPGIVKRIKRFFGG